ncbi:MAG: TIGR04255 family protein [Crocosphaera sp.]
MNLREFERVIYERNPLIEVVCQLRFPTILKIAHQEPVEFQDEIRFQYPIFESNQQKIPSEIKNAVQQFGIPLPGEQSYSFKSEDKQWELSITKDFIALKTSAYQRYEEFENRLREAVKIFERIYKPSFYTRIGLRYQDLIVPSKLKIDDVCWSDLISKTICAEIYDPVLGSSIHGIIKNLTLEIEYGKVNFKHGLVMVKDTEKSDEEMAYLLDSDFYTENKIEGNENVWKILKHFNKSARNLFRWSITDFLHKAMEPKPVDP